MKIAKYFRSSDPKILTSNAIELLIKHFVPLEANKVTFSVIDGTADPLSDIRNF